MAKKNHSKLAVRKETLRLLGASQLGQVVGGLASGLNCVASQNTGTLGSTLPSISGNLTTDEEVAGGSR